MREYWEEKGQPRGARNGLHDLCASETALDPHTQAERAAALYRLGFDVAAFSNRVNAERVASNTCAFAPVELSQLPPASLQGPWRRGPERGVSSKPHLRQISRLTVVGDELEPLQAAVSSRSAASYDLLAVEPLSERAFLASCSTLNVDVISLDLARKPPFKLRGQAIKAAIKRGVAFEVLFSPALRELVARRHFISNVRALAWITRGHGIVLSSAARSTANLRSPADVVNLGTFLGMTAEQAGDAVTAAPAAVLLRARKRKAFRGVVEFRPSVSITPVVRRGETAREGGALETEGARA